MSNALFVIAVVASPLVAYAFVLTLAKVCAQLR
jgi:hypothetical protein